jgi:hypothetical protein
MLAQALKKKGLDGVQYGTGGVVQMMNKIRDWPGQRRDITDVKESEDRGEKERLPR